MASLGRVFGRVAEDETPDDPFAEADRLLALLREHESVAEAARRALEYERDREKEIPRIAADAVTGAITPEEADRRETEIRGALAMASERVERVEALVVELRRRVSDAGRAACDEILERAGVPVAAATAALREAEAALERRRSEHDAARETFRGIEQKAELTLALYDKDHAAKLRASERRKEEQIAWACRQPRLAIQMLPLAWQAEATARYDALQAEAAEYRRGAEQRRLDALVNPKDAFGNALVP